MKNGENSTPQTTTTEEEEETLQLSASEERDMEPMFAMFSADVVARLIKSERWRTRDAALTEMNTVLLSAKKCYRGGYESILRLGLSRSVAKVSLRQNSIGAHSRRAKRPNSVHVLLRKNKL